MGRSDIAPMILARKTGLRCGASVLALSISLGAVSMHAHANPLDGALVAGSATISHEANLTTINQSSDRAIIDWRSFSVQKDETTQFNQPSVRAITVNRVTGNDLSGIYGNLRANGTVVLVNPNGVLFGSGGRVDVGGLIATVNDIDANSFMSGNSALRFISGGNGQGSIVNEGTITLKGAGLSAFVAPHVRNSGIITASLGQVALGSGNGFTVDLYGDGLLSFAPGQGLGQALSADTLALIENAGTITATRVLLSAEAAQSIVNQSINLSGVIRATSANGRGGVIQLSGSGAVRIEKDAVLSAAGAGSIDLKGGTISTDGAIIAEGGTIALKADGIMLGGTISASGRSGGSVSVDSAGLLSLADTVLADGQLGAGGSIAYKARRIIENSGSNTSASGLTNGGTITVTADSKLVSSGQYFAKGAYGIGGKIDLTASDIRLLSASLSASGRQQGGLVRIGGAFQGGKTPDVTAHSYNSFIGRWGPLATLQNASQTLINDTTLIDVSSVKGRGGTAIIWSDQRTTFLGAIDGRGASGAGSAEISSAGDLRQAELNNVRLGTGGHLLLDPKNIIIGTPETVQSWAYQGVIGSGISQDIDVALDRFDYLATSVSLNADGKLLAVGVPGDAGVTNSTFSSGAVYLFSFTDTNFSGGALEAKIGKGYSGGKNRDITTLRSKYEFGTSVSLNADGNRLAVGAMGDYGFANNRAASGAVYLFSFTDTNFSGATLESRLGWGYAGPKDINLDLNNGDRLGSSVSLNANGDRLAVGAWGDDGRNNTTQESGAVYLFSFNDTSFNGGTLRSTVGKGYIAANTVNVSALNDRDRFGSSVALNDDGDRLAVGAYGDDGTIPNSNFGAVYLFSFSDINFDGLTLEATIGRGYVGGKAIDLASLDEGDFFGESVDLTASGNRLAVGARSDNGLGNVSSDAGAIYIFDFIDNNFDGGTLESTIGKGYIGGKNIDLAALDDGDRFGTAVAFNAAGDRLAVGAAFDYGADNEAWGSGAVYLISFSDHLLNGGTLKARIGNGYRNFNLSALSNNDNFGSSVALNAAGDRLAVGARGDDGFGDSFTDSGAVYLFSFTNANFSGGALQSVIGKGYSGGKNFNLATAFAGDAFGGSVALNRTGNRLVVGAPEADGANLGTPNSGAVYLFSFSDDNFSDAALTSTIGKDADYNVGMLAGDDLFGSSVALNADGDRLAVGALGDDGAADSFSNSGAVYLFSFSGGDFTDTELVARIGKNYNSGSLDINPVNLDSLDRLGYSVSLNADGDRLAVGAVGDADGNNQGIITGAVYLFTFSDTNFSDGVQQAILGKGYTGHKNLNLTALGNFDFFGSSVALNAVGDRLAVGAFGDDGSDTGILDTGAVYLFSFSDDRFSDGALKTTIGKDYVRSNDVNLSDLEGGSNFGFSVALNAAGDRLAAGAYSSDGSVNGIPNSGKIFLFSGTNIDPTFDSNLYADLLGEDSTVSASDLALILVDGADVILQASNDITLSEDVTVAGSPYPIGALSLTAGRSILINANITTEGGNVNLVANDLLSNGVINAERDTGAAVITMAAGTTMDAGTGVVDIQILSGAGKTNLASGDITLRDITANAIKAVNRGPTAGSGIVLESGVLTAAGSATAIELAGADFTNNAGAAALSAVNGRWLVWSGDPANDNRGGLAYNFKQYRATYDASSVAQSTGNGFLYSLAPNIIPALAGTVAKTYDRSNTADLTGLSVSAINGGVDSDQVLVSLSAITGTFDTINAGTGKAITLSGLMSATSNGAATVYGYQLITPALTGTIIPKALIVSGITADSRPYDGTTSAGLNLNGAAISGVVFGDVTTLSTSSGVGVFSSKAVGMGKTVTVNGLGLTGFDAGNYSLSPYTTLADITPKALTATGIRANDKTYDGTTLASLDLSSAILNDVVVNDSVDISTTSATQAFLDKAVGTGKAVTVSGLGLSGADAGNYTLSSTFTTNADITAKALTATGITANSRVYDGTAAATLNGGGAGLSGVITNDLVSLTLPQDLLGAFGDKNAGTGKTVTVSGLGLTGADAGNYSLSLYSTLADITAKALTVTGITANSRAYDGSASARLNLGSANLTGTLFDDLVSLVTSLATGAFSSKTVGAGKIVTIKGLGLMGADAGNYVINPLTTFGDITPKSLTATGIRANDKTYDGTATASLNLNNAGLSGLVEGDATLLDTRFAIGMFSNASAASGKTVTISGLGLSGTDAANYSLASTYSTQADITPKALMATGISANSKTYDARITATLNLDSAGLSGWVSDDLVSLVTVSASGSFNDKTVGVGKTVTVSGLGLSGADAGNYRISPYSTVADISAKALTVTGITANSRDYDGSTSARLNLGSANLTGVIVDDLVDLVTNSATGAFSSKTVGAGKTVTINGLSLNGADAGNYIINTVTTLADISIKALTATGIKAENKRYDGNTTARLVLTGATLNGVADGDVTTLNTAAVTGTFADKAVGKNKLVSISGLGLLGTDSGNYTIADATTTADIATTGTTIFSMMLNMDTIDTSYYLQKGRKGFADIPFGEIPYISESAFAISILDDKSKLLTVDGAPDGDDDISLSKRATRTTLLTDTGNIPMDNY